MLKKIFSSLLVCIFSLTSCSLGDIAMRKNSNQTATEMFEKIIECIENQDSGGLKSLFSLNAVNEADNIDKSILELFEIYKGKMVSYDDHGGGYESARVNHGIVKKKRVLRIDVETTESKYHMAVLEIAKDTEFPDAEGVYTIYILETDKFLCSDEWLIGGWDKLPYGISFGSLQDDNVRSN